MQEIIARCDHCGRRLSDDNDFFGIELDLGHSWNECDLCAECFEELVNMVEKFIGKRKVD